MDAVIETQNLTKQFASRGGWRRLARKAPHSAVNSVSLTVERGELFGLLGPNGAGKTTLVKMLCTLVLPTRGTAKVAGYPLQQAARIRAAVGLMVTDDRSFYWRLSGRENLRFFAALHRIHDKAAERRVDEVLEQVEMATAADHRFSDYSSGMKQRLALARCLLHRPRLLFLDEPSRSLDPLATRRLHGMLLQLVAAQRVTIFLITHDLSEAEALCSRVAVMHQGAIRSVGEPAAMRRTLRQKLQYDLLVDRLSGEAEAQIRRQAPDLQVEAAGGGLRLGLTVATEGQALNTVLDVLRGGGSTIFSIESKAPSLEEAFARLTAGQE